MKGKPKILVHEFNNHFIKFIQPHHCQQHTKTQNFVCIDNKCENKGLICSGCLTIHGKHKNHDSIEITQFIETYCHDWLHSPKDRALDETLQRINTVYEALLKQLTEFHEKFSKIIEAYILKKNEIHQKYQVQFLQDNLLDKLQKCDFESIQEMNKCIIRLINRKQGEEEYRITRQKEKNAFQAQLYLSKLEGETQILQDYCAKLYSSLKSRLSVDISEKTQSQFNKPEIVQTQLGTYIGEVHNKKYQGKGVLYDRQNQIVYYGDFNDGFMHGYGEIHTQKGDCYMGQFKASLKNGYGTYHWIAENNQYQGYYKNGKRDGKGQFIWNDGSRYCGEFSKGEQDGYGILYRGFDELEYEGRWLNGMFHGTGIQYFENGQKFDGNFKEDQFHGGGIFYKKNEIIYGTWKNNQLIEVNNIKQATHTK